MDTRLRNLLHDLANEMPVDVGVRSLERSAVPEVVVY
jgi:hypothetical protein